MKSPRKSGDETRDARHAEQAVSRRGQNPALDDAGRDITRVQQIVKLEKEAKAQHHDEFPHRTRRR
jgi:hypothetical protein